MENILVSWWLAIQLKSIVYHIEILNIIHILQIDVWVSKKDLNIISDGLY